MKLGFWGWLKKIKKLSDEEIEHIDFGDLTMFHHEYHEWQEHIGLEK